MNEVNIFVLVNPGTNADNSDICIVYGETLSVGVNMLMEFVSELSSVLPELTFTCVERHPKNKAKPTQTANRICDIIKKNNKKREYIFKRRNKL